MGTLTTIARVLKPPKLEDLTNAPRQVQQEVKKTKMNNIDVILLDEDFKAGDQVVGTISRKTKISMVRVNAPEPLAFFKVKGASFFNRTTGRQMMIAVSGYPYGLQLDRQLEDEQANDLAGGEITTEGYQLPVLLDKLPYYVHKKKAEEHLRTLAKDDYFELTPSMLEDLGNVNLTDGVTESENKGVAVAVLIGIFMGMAILSLLQAFAAGG